MLLVLLAACDGTPVAGPDSDVASEDTDRAPRTCEPWTIEAWQTFARDDGDWEDEVSPSGVKPGVGVGDLDNDGDLDLLFVHGGGTLVLENDGDGTLTIVDPDTTALPPGGSVALADLDADGDLDAWVGRVGENDVILYNQGGFSFETEILPDSEGTPGSGSFVDLDGDGDLDLFVSGFVDELDLYLVAEGAIQGQGHRLWLREGDGWLDARDRIPAEIDHAIAYQASPLDADGDGDIDIYLANDVGAGLPANVLLLNDGTAHFTVDDSCGCQLAIASMGSHVGDADHDGWPDVLVSDFGSPRLVVSTQDGRFVDVTAAYGLEIPATEDHSSGWATMITDLDLDGCQDLIVTYGECCNSNPDFLDAPDQYDQLLFGDCTGAFTREEPYHPGFDETGRSRALAKGDLDGDGDEDIITVGKGFLRTWKVSGGCPTGLVLTLEGTPGNPQAFGAKVDVEVDGAWQTMWQLPYTASSSSGLDLHIGLGTAWQADLVRVTWPSGEVTEHHDVPTGALTLTAP